MEHHAEVLKGGVWQQRIPSWRDLVAVVLVLAVLILIGLGARQMVAPLLVAQQPEISLSPTVFRSTPSARRCGCWPRFSPR